MPHANTRLTLHGRALLIERVVSDGRPVSHVAKELGISRQCAHRWINRHRAEGSTGLLNRSSRPRSCPRRTSSEREAAVVVARLLGHNGPLRIAAVTGVPSRTVSRILGRYDLPPLSWLDPVTGAVIRSSRATAVRYERERPGELVHVDVKKLGRIPDGGGWRADPAQSHGTHRKGPQRVGFDYVHVVIDDYSRLAYAEIHPDEKGATAAGVLERAATFFAQNGIAHIERLNRTLATEWAYARKYTSNNERAEALAPWLNFYNTERIHTGIGQTPLSRVSPTS